MTDALQLKERSSMPTVNPDVQPVVILDDLAQSLEGARGERRTYMHGHAQGGTAGNPSHLFLINPPDNKFVALLRWGYIAAINAPDPASVTTNTVLLKAVPHEAYALSPQQKAFPMNQRNLEWDPPPAVAASSIEPSSCSEQGTSGVIVASGVTLQTIYCAQQTVTVDLHGMVLTPGGGVAFQTMANNVGIVGGWQWDEVPMVR